MKGIQKWVLGFDYPSQIDFYQENARKLPKENKTFDSHIQILFILYLTR